MTHTNLRINVPEPCHEDWAKMTPQQQGRHCKSCDKVVVDFSVMSDAQIVDYLKNYQGKGCGRFKSTQINRDISVVVGKRLFKPVKYMAASFLALQLFSQKAKAHDVIDTSGSVQNDTIQLISPVVTEADTIQPIASDTLSECEMPLDTTYAVTVNDTNDGFTVHSSPTIIGDINIVVQESFVCGGFGIAPQEVPSLFTPVKISFLEREDRAHMPSWFNKGQQVFNSYIRKTEPARSPPLPQHMQKFSVATIVKRLKMALLSKV